MILVIDNYDSFTWNLVHYFMELDVEVQVFRNDAISTGEAMALHPQAVVLSPGPRAPNEAGNSLDITHACMETKTPLFGVCLGHQVIAQACGGKIIRASVPMHGKTSLIFHDTSGVFANIPDPFTATRYHSLIVEKESLPQSLQVNAQTDDHVIMGLRHKDLVIHGVQFHPESIATEYGHALLCNFLDDAGIKHKRDKIPYPGA